MKIYCLPEALVLALPRLHCQVMFGAFVTHARPPLPWFHIALTFLRHHARTPGLVLARSRRWKTRSRAMRGLLHYLDALVYPDVPPSLLIVCGVAVCLFNLGIYAICFRPASTRFMVHVPSSSSGIEGRFITLAVSDFLASAEVTICNHPSGI